MALLLVCLVTLSVAYGLSLDPTGAGMQSRMQLKNRLFAECASCDRGFASVPSQRLKIGSLIDQLSAQSPEDVPTRGLYPNDTGADDDSCPLEGTWKMIYTSALDVLTLGANPLTTVQGIYQTIRADGGVENVIDVAPRLQAALPLSLVGEGSTLRARVAIRASARQSARVGLTFTGLRLQPRTLLGADVSSLPPFKIDFPSVLPTLFSGGGKGFGAEQGAELDSPGFFNVLYLDEDTLIIKQNEPGGLFVSIRDDPIPLLD
ncbi:hypothetical protein B484DRAFT_455161 [Ochromonadaceae sp. CCMP2298]|nr:hypothetical protein B484DRAFT_455161 [Ochromonadaceae sp. CCMP2298]